MKTISLRGFSRDAPTINEEVLILHNRRVVGRFTPFNKETALSFDMADVWDHLEDAPMEEPVKKELNKEAPKVDQSGNLRKGLGPLPGEDPNLSFREFRPVPKPKK
jgi:hypothetical protein